MRKMTFFACAALLTSAVALTGCKGDDQNTPQYSGEVVKTEFSIAMPDQLAGPKRMASSTVQDAGYEDFSGLSGITLIPFAKQGEITGTDTRIGDLISLAALTKAEVNKTNRAKVYENVSIPLTTASFLFYAKATRSGKDFEVGALLPTPSDLDANPADITFDLKQIQPTGATKVFENGGAGKSLLTYLTSIACANDGQGTPKKWYEYTEGMNAGMYAMFNTFVTMHGLSSFEVERVLTDLYKSLKPLYSSTPIAKAICDSINAAAYATVNASDEVELIAALDKFPGSYGLPDGSVDIRWNSTNHKFENGTYSNMAALENYVYPAQLWYYVNSQIKTSNKSQKTAYESTTNEWSAILGLHTDGLAVNSKTRAVAIEDKIQYAVARLDVAVKLNAIKLADNSDLAVGASGEDAKVDCTAGFPVTAILVGGQQQVKFDFTTNGGTEYTIYDSIMAQSGMKALSSGWSVYNHTLVLENGTQKVRVAVEMVNDAADFYGYENMLIPHGGKFYVVAELDPAKSGDEATETGGHVFKQDFKTIANLTLKDLRKAYNTIPDLRTPQLELGFSVDLTWQAGHTFNVDFN